MDSCKKFYKFMRYLHLHPVFNYGRKMLIRQCHDTKGMAYFSVSSRIYR